MDVVLQTGCDDPALSLTSVERFGDGSGYVSRLDLVSGEFRSLGHRFFFGAPELRECIADLTAKQQTLRGSARLFQQYEPDVMVFEMESLGRVRVSGELHLLDEFETRLYFGFRTDQTVLAPLIRDLGACVDMPVRGK